MKKEEKNCCWNCACSLSGDDDNDERYLVCFMHGYDRVPEDGYCEDYN